MICSLCKTYALEFIGSRKIGLDDAAIWNCTGCTKEEYECLCAKREHEKYLKTISPSVVFK